MVNGTVNRNASASAFGWEFQTNAAIVLFIRNIEEARSLRVEGAHEDIESPSVTAQPSMPKQKLGRETSQVKTQLLVLRVP